MTVHIDRYGSPEYQQSFQKYLTRSLQAELFDPNILIDSARSSDFIQLSDFITGSIRKSLQGDFAQGDRLLNLFQPRWPIRVVLPDMGHHIRPLELADEHADLVACVEEAGRYLEINSSNRADPKIRTLEYLYYSALDGNSEWVYTQEILDWLQGLGFDLSEEQFRIDVTASLRDEGLIIVGSRRGLKIPCTSQDFMEYMAFSVNLALPVLKRLKKAISFVSIRTPLKEVNSLLSDEMRRILENVDA